MAISQADFKNELTIVIRANGERTEVPGLKLMQALHKKENVFIVHETPFAKALEKSFRIGVQENRKWLLCNDADVLPVPDLIDFLYYKVLMNHEEGVFEYHTRVFDQFYGGVRPGGVKLYNASTLKHALKFIPDVFHSIRPESDLINKMQQVGYKKVKVKRLGGIHDYEQYYKHLFLKGYSHAGKHKAQMKILLPFWKRMAEKNNDFKVALKGLYAGLKGAKVNRESAKMAMQEMGVQEKDPIDYIPFDDVLELIRLNDEPPEYYHYLQHIKKRRKSPIKKLIRFFRF